MDVRTDQQFDDAHIPGAVCIPMLRAGFGSKLAWLADREQEIVLIGRDDEDGRVAGRLAVAVGVRTPRRLPARRHDQLAPGAARGASGSSALALDELTERAAAEPELQMLDVREQAEWDAGHIPGSTFVPWHDITRCPTGLDPARPIAVMCASGQRAATGGEPAPAPRRAST